MSNRLNYNKDTKQVYLTDLTRIDEKIEAI